MKKGVEKWLRSTLLFGPGHTAGLRDVRVIIIDKLEIHACNNPSPVFKRCILSAVSSTSSQGVCQVR